MTTPRSRTGLAKLRGGTQPSEPDTDQVTAPAAEPEEAAPAPPPADTPASPPTVDLLKPGKEPVPAGGATPGGQQRSRRLGGRLLTAIVAGIVAVALLLFFVLRWDDQLSGGGSGGSASVSSSGAHSDARLAALRAARQFTVSFFTYDYRNIDAYFRRIEAASTGGFRSDFISKEKTLKTVVTQLKTVANGQVPDAGAGIFALADDKAVALVAANFNASNAVTKNGQRRYRVKLSLQLIKGQWLVSDFSEVV